jgi:MFS family permease
MVGGTLPIFFHESLGALIASSALIGIGEGFLISIATAILAEHFDGNTRGWAIGLKQAASSLGIAGLTIATGFLCTLAWYKAYYIFLLTIPIIFLVALLLPQGKLDVKIIGKGVVINGLKRVFNPGMIYMCVLFFFLGTFNFAFYTNIGMSIISKGLGGASVIGLATAWNSLPTILIGIGFGLVLHFFKKWTLASCMIITSIAFFILAIATSLSMIVSGVIIFGIGAGIQLPGSVYYVTEAVDSEVGTLGIGVAMCAVSLGISFSPVIINTIVKTFGTIDGTSGLMVGAVAYIAMFFIEIIREAVFNKDSKIGFGCHSS